MSISENLNAFHLIDDTHNQCGANAESPYDTDHRGAGGRMSSFGEYKSVKSVGNKFPSYRKRELNEQKNGVLTFEFTYHIVSGDGFYIGFFGDKGDEKEAVVLRQKNGFICAGNTQVVKCDNNWHYVKLVMDIDKGTFKLHFEGKFVKELPFTGKAKSISRFVFGYEAQSVGEAELESKMELYKNYLFCDNIIPMYEGNLPEEYCVVKEGKAKVGMRRYSPHSRYSCYYVNASKDSNVKILRHFSRAKGNVCFQFKYLLPKNGATLTVSLLNNDQKAISVFDKLTALCTKDGVLRNHLENVWQTLRIEADTDTNTALVRLNGKVCSVIAFDNVVEFIDGVMIEIDCKKSIEVEIAELRAFIIPPEPSDYVPEPVIPKKKGDYYIGMNICSLWREGSHIGWDCITPFPENKPVLGYYDEGVIETADWELKFMAEHGLDFQLYCWYSSEVKKPMLRTMLSSAIFEGHMLAKYSDKVKIALLWEAASSPYPSSFEDLRDYVFPYFIDYFFTDPRYMTIDGNAIMSIYASDRLASWVGGVDVLKKALDYLRKEVKKLGYRDLIIMCCGDSSEFFGKLGVDAVHAYSWGINGYDVKFTKGRILSNMKEGSVHTVPTVSMGYNHTGWTGVRTPVLEPDDMVTLLEWVKNDILTQYDKNSWKSKLVMLSTWNEYGEGTYMMPAGVHGFGYLDALRKVFYEDTPHVDVVPNENQKARICNLYPRDRYMLAAQDNLPEDKTEQPILKKYEFKTQKDLEKWEIVGLSNYEIRDGKLVGHSDGKDPYMILHDDEFLPVDTDKIGKITVYCRTSKPVDAACCIQHGYMFEKDKWFGYMPNRITTPDMIVPLAIEPLKERGVSWHGTLYGFRFDPVYNEGDFELESIIFYEASARKELVIDGDIVEMKHDLVETDGVVYIPFDPKSALKDIHNLYFEWNKHSQSLYLYGEKDAVFTKDSNAAIIDGKELKLEKAVEFYDGLPLIPAELFADVIGRKIKITKKEVFIEL